MLSHKHIQRSLTLFVVLLGIFLIPETGLAQAVGGNAAMPTGVEQTIATLVSQLIGFINILIWMLFIFLNFVLDPQFIFDLDNGSFMNMLNQIWQLSRDLMNIAFALILIGTAIYTIVTANKEFVSQHAKKFIMAVVLVNFSWFFPRVILDVANVATSTIYGIPSLLFEESGANSCTYKTSAPVDAAACTEYAAAEPGVNAIYSCPCRVVVNADMFPSDADKAALVGPGWDCSMQVLCIQTEAWSPSLIAGHSAILNGLILNHAHLGTLANVPGPVNGDDVGQMARFLLVEGIIVIIHLALFFPLLAMFVAFLIRIPILWLTMAAMPFYFLDWALSGNALVGETKKIWDYFIKAAFLPAMVAIPLSVGFVLVNAGAQLSPSAISGIKIRLIDGISDYWQLLWWMMTLGVMWVGTFAAFQKAGGIFEKATSGIKSYGEAWGKVALKAPLSVPLPGMSMTPLKAFSTLHPRTIDAQLSSDEGLAGLPGMVNNALKGKGGQPQNTPAQQYANSTDAELTQLHKDLKDLEVAMRGKNAADKQALIDTFKQNHNGLDLSGNHGQKMDDFLKEMRRINPNLNTADPNRNFDTIKQEFINRH